MITAYTFIDWDSARRIIRPKWNPSDDQKVTLRDRASNVEECFTELQSRVAAKLVDIEPGRQIRIIRNRIYHGWHSGKTETLDRRAWEDAVPRLRPVVRNKISFLADVEYGNVLSCGGRRLPLFDTLRHRDGGQDQQKMVDTALVSDLLSYCRTESRNFKRGQKPDSMAIVIGDDDDLLPGVIVAEQWGLPTYVFRVTREDESKHLNIAGLTYRL
ncbi:hypothetical protein [Cupriavidus nantongensis]|uniref:hypothetical protein n=1 Tax=Cupriavidus nantongensis TaxID=1796606 RepID=UPI000B14134B|nr:hypothetical protein [Cupriavidus nantongensis]